VAGCRRTNARAAGRTVGPRLQFARVPATAAVAAARRQQECSLFHGRRSPGRFGALLRHRAQQRLPFDGAYHEGLAALRAKCLNRSHADPEAVAQTMARDLARGSVDRGAKDGRPRAERQETSLFTLLQHDSSDDPKRGRGGHDRAIVLQPDRHVKSDRLACRATINRGPMKTIVGLSFADETSRR
jgi:hypothetical protein